MKPVARVFGLTSIFIGGFLFFLLLTFDYGVLKEALSSQISQQTGMNITIGAMRPSFPLGIELDDFLLQNPDSQRLELKRIKVKLSLLNLFIGKLGILTELTSATGGSLEAYCKFSLFEIIKGTATLPSRLELNSRQFPLENSISFALKSLAAAPTTNPLLAPILKEITFSTNLDATIDLLINTKDPGQSAGTIDAKFRQAKLMLNTPSLALPDQEFQKAEIVARIDSGNLKFDEKSGFQSKDLELSINGSIKLASPLAATGLKMRIGIKFMEALRESLGFVLGAFSGAGDSGEMAIELNGTVGTPQVQTM
jgi:type II secretion system protein N